MMDLAPMRFLKDAGSRFGMVEVAICCLIVVLSWVLIALLLG